MSTLKAINLQHPTASTANITLSNTGGIALNGSVSGGGMDLITPTSVAGSGVTLSGGQVSFSAATSVSINGCFSTTYDNYILTYAGTVSADMQFRIRMRLSGTDASGSNYNHYQGVGTATWSGGTATTTSMPVAGHINGGEEAFSAEIYNPALAKNTLFISNGLDAVRTRLDIYLGNHAVATAYDGMTIFPTAGTMTGIFRVYGLRNS